jgi:hypothetical protein
MRLCGMYALGDTPTYPTILYPTLPYSTLRCSAVRCGVVYVCTGARGGGIETDLDLARTSDRRCEVRVLGAGACLWMGRGEGRKGVGLA